MNVWTKKLIEVFKKAVLYLWLSTVNDLVCKEKTQNILPAHSLQTETLIIFIPGSKSKKNFNAF